LTVRDQAGFSRPFFDAMRRGRRRADQYWTAAGEGAGAPKAMSDQVVRTT